MKWLVKWCPLSFYTDRHIKRAGLLYSQHSLSYHHRTPQELTGSSSAHATWLEASWQCFCWLCHQGNANLTTLLGAMGSPPRSRSKSAVTPLGFHFRKANLVYCAGTAVPWRRCAGNAAHSQVLWQPTPIPARLLLTGTCVAMPQTCSQRSQGYFVIALEWQ